MNIIIKRVFRDAVYTIPFDSFQMVIILTPCIPRKKSQESNNYISPCSSPFPNFFQRSGQRTHEGKGRKFISTGIVEFHPSWKISSCITHKIPYIRQAVTGNSISTCNEVPLFDSAYFRIFQTFVPPFSSPSPSRPPHSGGEKVRIPSRISPFLFHFSDRGKHTAEEIDHSLRIFPPFFFFLTSTLLGRDYSRRNCERRRLAISCGRIAKVTLTFLADETATEQLMFIIPRARGNERLDPLVHDSAVDTKSVFLNLSRAASLFIDVKMCTSSSKNN